MSDLYTLFPDVAALAPEVPADAILSRTFFKDDRLSAMVFSFAPGQELSEHTSAYPAIIHILSGRAQLTRRGHDDGRVRHVGAHDPAPAPLRRGRDAGGHASIDAQIITN